MDATTIAAAAFALNVGVQIVGAVWAVAKIKQEITEKIADEVLARTSASALAVESRNAEMEKLRREFSDAQRTQDHNMGEMGSALRRFIETVEKEMHDIEIWGRDNYVQKGEFEKATDLFRNDITTLRTEIKADFKELGAMIAAKK